MMELIFILIFIWLVCGIIAAIIGYNKGGSGCLAFIVGSLLGPLGLIFTIVLPKDKEKIEKRALKSGTMKKCQYCAEIIKTEATVCRYCGKNQE